MPLVEFDRGPDIQNRDRVRNLEELFDGNGTGDDGWLSGNGPEIAGQFGRVTQRAIFVIILGFN